MDFVHHVCCNQNPDCCAAARDCGDLHAGQPECSTANKPLFVQGRACAGAGLRADARAGTLSLALRHVFVQGGPDAEAAERAQALGRAQTRALERLQHEGVPALSLVYNLVACLRITLAAGPATNPGANPELTPSTGAQPDGTARQLCKWLARLLLTCTDPDPKPNASASSSPAASPAAPLPPTAAPAPSKPRQAGPPDRRESGKAAGPGAVVSPGRTPDKRRSGRGSMIVVALPAPAEAGAQSPSLDHKPIPDPAPTCAPDPPNLPAVAAVLEHFVAGDAAFAALRSANRASRARPSRAESRRASLFVAPHLNPGAKSVAAPASPKAGRGPAASPVPASAASNSPASPLSALPLARMYLGLPLALHVIDMTATAGPGEAQPVHAEALPRLLAGGHSPQAGLSEAAEAEADGKAALLAKGAACQPGLALSQM